VPELSVKFCNLVFRTKFLRPDTIGIIPAQGYRSRRKTFHQSHAMDQILINNDGVRIQHARNGGETEIGPYKVDGYYENENGQNTSWNLTESSDTVS
jgi:hypothetical protein